MEEEAQSVRGRGWVKFDGEEETDSGKGNSESPGSLEVRARPVQCAVCTQGVTLVIVGTVGVRTTPGPSVGQTERVQN